MWECCGLANFCNPLKVTLINMQSLPIYGIKPCVALLSAIQVSAYPFNRAIHCCLSSSFIYKVRSLLEGFQVRTINSVLTALTDTRSKQAQIVAIKLFMLIGMLGKLVERRHSLNCALLSLWSSLYMEIS